MQKKSRKNNIAETVIIIVLLLLIVFSFVINALFYNESKAPLFLEKYYVYVTNEEKTIGNIDEKTAVICDRTLAESAGISNVVLAIINEENDKALLRIAEMDDKNCLLQNDVNGDTILVNRRNVIGLCTNISRSFGKFVTFATASQGIVLLIVLPATIIVLLQALKILDKEDTEEESETDNQNEKERKLKEKKAKEDAKRKKFISEIGAENSDEQEDEDNIYIIEKTDEGIPKILPVTDESEDDEQQEETIFQRIARKKAEKLMAEKAKEEKTEEIIPQQEIKVPEEIISEQVKQEEPYTDLSQFNKPFKPEKSEIKSEPIQIVKPEKSEIESETVQPVKSEESEVKSEPIQLIKPEKSEIKPEIKVSQPVSEPVPVMTEIKSEQPTIKIQKSESNTTEIKKSAPAKKKSVSASASKYSSNKYASKRSSKTSVDDLLKTIDKEKSKINK